MTSTSFLKKGTVVSVETLNQAIIDNLYYLALDKGVNYLSTYHSRKEVMMYLRKQYDDDIVDRVVLKLEELKLIDLDSKIKDINPDFQNLEDFTLNDLEPFL